VPIFQASELGACGNDLEIQTLAVRELVRLLLGFGCLEGGIGQSGPWSTLLGSMRDDRAGHAPKIPGWQGRFWKSQATKNPH